MKEQLIKLKNNAYAKASVATVAASTVFTTIQAHAAETPNIGATVTAGLTTVANDTISVITS
ncbi:MAG: hypothetical protein ACRC7N_20060, partial [Clostridium sp.]